MLGLIEIEKTATLTINDQTRRGGYVGAYYKHEYGIKAKSEQCCVYVIKVSWWLEMHLPPRSLFGAPDWPKWDEYEKSDPLKRYGMTPFTYEHLEAHENRHLQQAESRKDSYEKTLKFMFRDNKEICFSTLDEAEKKKEELAKKLSKTLFAPNHLYQKGNPQADEVDAENAAYEVVKKQHDEYLRSQDK